MVKSSIDLENVSEEANEINSLNRVFDNVSPVRFLVLFMLLS